MITLNIMTKQRIFLVTVFYVGFMFKYLLALSKVGLKTKDYCDWEVFNPTCPINEVVIIEKAEIGIMQKGRCIDNDYGLLGCSSDQLSYIDGICSGLQSCEVDVGSKEIKDRIECPFHYLLASYFCQKIINSSQAKCYQATQIEVKHTLSYLASHVTKETMCGLGNSPWLLQADPGQMINLTLIDFAWGQEVDGGISKCRRPYGHILRYDNNDVSDICGGLVKEKHLALIPFHQVQIVLQETAVQANNFLVKFQAIGCPNIVPPKNAWMSKDGNDVTIGCHTSSVTWKLKCVGNHWIGVVGNCSQIAVVVVPVEEESFTRHHVLAVAVGCCAVIVCCITVTIGAYCIRRYKTKVKSKYSTNQAHDMYLMPSKQSSVAMRTLSNPHSMPRRQGSTLPHPELQGLHMCGPNCTCTLTNKTDHHQNEHTTDDSVLYYVLEQPEPPIYENNNSSVNINS